MNVQRKHNDDTVALQLQITCGRMNDRRGNIGQRAFLTARQRFPTATLTATATAMAQRDNYQNKVSVSVLSNKKLALPLFQYQ